MAIDPLQDLIARLGAPTPASGGRPAPSGSGGRSVRGVQIPDRRERRTVPRMTRPGAARSRTSTYKPLEGAFPGNAQPDDDGGGGFGGALGDIGGALGKGLLQVLDIADTPRAFVAAGIKDVVDENDSVDLGQIWDDAMRNIRFNEAVGIDEADTPGPDWLKAPLGFATDLLTDPLTYTGVGFVTQGAKSAGMDVAQNAIVSAAKHGSRKELAKAVAVQSTRTNLDDLGEAGARVVSQLTDQAARRGRGAFTRKGLSRIGVDEQTVQEVVQRIGADLDFRYGLRYGLSRTSKTGASITRPLAEASANAKGALTHQLFGGSIARSLRPWFLAEQSNYNKIANDLLSSRADDPVQAALDLARIEAARGFSRKFVDSHVRSQIDAFGPRLKRLDRTERAKLRDELEMALLDPNAMPTSELGVQLRQTFDDLFDDLKNHFDDGLEYRRGYLPHFLTPEGKRWAANNAEAYKAILGATDTPAFFQKARQIVAGRAIGKTTLQEGTIREINDVAARELGVARLLEDDPLKLLAHYTAQAGEVAYERALLDMAHQYGMTVEIPLVATKQAVDPANAEIIKAQMQAESDRAMGALNTAGQATQESVGRRAGALEEVGSELQAEVQISQSIVGQLEKEIEDVSQETIKAAADRTSAQVAKIKGAATVESLQGAARKARRNHRAKWNRVIRDNEKMIEVDPGRATIYRARITEAKERLLQMSPEEQALQVAIRDHERAVNVFAQADDALADAKNRLAWLQADLPSVRAQHAKIVAAFEATTVKKPRGMAPQVWRDYNDMLRERVGQVQAMLEDPTFDGIGFLDKLRRTEAQASEFDMLALKQRRIASDAQAVEKVLADQLFYDDMVRQLDDGFIRYSDTYQLPQEARDRLAYEVKTVQEKLANQPEILQVVGAAYDKMLGLWKQYAVATPGFVTRNMYGGLFNMFVLDDVSTRSVNDFMLVMRAYRTGKDDWADRAAQALVSRANPTGRAWRREAAQAGVDPLVYARQVVDTRFQESLTAAAATGFGQVPAELGHVPILEGGNWNPLSNRFHPTRQVRKGSEWVEELLRGSHAYDVLTKGGTVEDAIGRVSKFHFNYQDIGKADQVMKRIIPFWTFWSRNLPLQAQMWLRSPQKINRTIVNATSNIEALSESDLNEPDYFADLGMTRLPVGTGDGGHMYGALDVPTMRLPDDVNRLDLTENPLGPLADAAPWFKLPMEMAFNKNSFYNTEFKGELYESDQQGGYRVREAPAPLDLPLVRNIADLFPGIDFVGDQLAITDKAQHVWEQLPPTRYQKILLPEKRDEASATARRVSALFGVQWRPNTKEMQERKAYFDSLDEREQARVDAILRELGA